jgi:uncharacterized protein YggE
MLPVASLVAGAWLASGSSAQTIQINRENKTIAISTTDEATATADIAAITVGYEVYGPDSDTAYASGAKISRAVLDALHKIGVEDKSIESGSQGVERNTDFNDKDTPEQRAQRQFVMRQSWVVSVPPQSAAEVIRVAVAADANQTGSIEWRLSDRKVLQAKAAENALVKARAVASQMADGLHVKLGELIYASNETPTARIYFKTSQPETVSSFGVAGTVVQNLPPLEIRPQAIREEATVYAVFAIE